MARICAIFLFLFWSTVNEREFIAYNSEHLVILLTTLGTYLLYSISNSSISAKKVCFLGIALGIIPYAKLQGVPIGFCIGILAILQILIYSRIDRRSRILYLISLVIGVLLPSLMFGIYLTAHSCWGDFWQDYIMANLKYAHTGQIKGLTGIIQPLTGFNKLTILLRFIRVSMDLRLFIGMQILLALIVTVYHKGVHWSFLFRDKIIVWGLLIAATAYVCVGMPGNAISSFLHYSILFIFPFSILISSVIGTAARDSRREPSRVYDVLLFLPFLPYLLYVMAQPVRGITYISYGTGYPLSHVSKVILQYAHPDEKMVVWGWAPHYYVETGLIQGYKASISSYVMAPVESGQQELEDFVQEMKENEPIVFVDAVYPNAINFNKDKYHHENYPGLNEYISQNYKEVADCDERTRIYHQLPVSKNN